jgi:curved DNA-binding protein CbpA
MNRSSSDPYAVLGLRPNAPEKEVAKKYRALSKRFHPDLNQGDPQAAEIFKEVTWAYQTISTGRAQQSRAGGGVSDSFDADLSREADHPFFGFFHAVRAYCMSMNRKEE